MEDHTPVLDDNILLFKTIFNQSPISTQIFTPDGETVMVNAAWENLWNIKFGTELKHYNVLKDQQLNDQKIMPYIKKGFKGQIIDVPAILYIPDKSINVKEARNRWVSARMFPIKDAKGNLTHVVIQHEDVTERKQTEEVNARLAAIVASSDDAIVSKTLDGIIRSWNKSAERLFGHKAKEAIGKHISLIIPDRLIDEETVIISKLKKGERIEHFETIRRKKNGEELYVSLTISPILDPSGNVIGASKIARDITAQIAAEQTLKENEERLRIAIEAGNIGIWDWDVLHDDLVWSERVYAIHGVSPKTFPVTIESFSTFIHPEDKERVNEAVTNALKGMKPFALTFRVVTPDGETKWVATSAKVLRDKKGKAIRMLGATSDVTKERQLEQDRNDFIGIATHELKTPVTSIKAYAEVLERKFTKAGDDFSAAQLSKMNMQLNKLTLLISDLLDVTKIESGKLQMHAEKFDFDMFITDTVEEMQRTTERHTIIIQGAVQTHIIADRDRVGQVLSNLLSNAIKYSPDSNEITVAVTKTKSHVQVSVTDHGIGIAKSNQSHLFERFYRINGPKGNTFPGLGLGLYISAEIIARQNGEIWVESASGKGSTFSFRLPLKK